MTEDPDEEKQKRIQQIRNLYAFDLFSQHSFDESLRIFAELGTGQYCAVNFVHTDKGVLWASLTLWVLYAVLFIDIQGYVINTLIKPNV